MPPRLRYPQFARNFGAPRLREQRFGRPGPALGTTQQRFGFPSSQALANRAIRGFQGRSGLLGPPQIPKPTLSPRTPTEQFAPPNPTPGGGRNVQPVAQAAAAAQPAGFGLPLDPAFEAQRRALEDSLASALLNIGIAREEIPAMVRMLSNRIMTDQQLANRQVNEAVNARGLYNSGIRQTELGIAGLPFDRARQDLALEAARQYQELLRREADARLAYQQGLTEALIALQQRVRELGVPLAGGGGGGGGRAKKKVRKGKAKK